MPRLTALPRAAWRVALALLSLAGIGNEVSAQSAVAVTPDATKMVFHACYDPAVGALYLIKQPGLASKCLKAGHLEIVLRGAPSDDPTAATVPSGPAGGDLAGTYPDPVVARLQGSPISTTAPVAGQAMFYSAGQWRPVTPAFSGDVTGGINTLKVVKLQNLAVSPTAPTAGQALLWDGVTLAWTPSALPAGITAHNQLTGLGADDHLQYLPVKGVRPMTGDLLLGNNKITGLAAGVARGDAVPWEQAIKNADPAGGDLSGTYPAPTVAKLRGNALSANAPANGQVLQWNAATLAWTPSTPASGVTVHSQLSGLAADDHTQYLLGNAVRTVTNGFAVTGTFGSGTLPATGAGTRLLWFPRKAAFRAGAVDATQWDDASIGLYSAALGRNTTALGRGAVSLGEGNSASADGAVALGFGSNAIQKYALASGYQTSAGATVTGSCSPLCAETALGSLTTASGRGATAMGYQSVASGSYATAMGKQTTASDVGATSMGEGTVASNNGATAMGGSTTASGFYSTSMGALTIAQSEYSVAIGYNNSDTGNPNLWVSTDPIFMIGDGAFGSRSNAFKVLKNGEVYANGSFHGSDIRLKEDIRPLRDVLTRLQEVRGVTFRWRKPTSKSDAVQIGMIAQEVQRAFPELVRTDEKGYLSVSYANFTAVLVAAIQEQQQQIADLRAALAALPQGREQPQR